MAAEEAAPSLADLILSLEQASFMAKQLPSTSNPAHLLQIHNSLHQANLNLSLFLSPTHFPQSHPSTNHNSLSSATTAAAAFYARGNDPMQLADDEDADAEHSSKGTIELVEEKMKDCFIKNKRLKRQLSPSAAAVAEERRLHRDDRFVAATAKGFDPRVERLRALDLISQFHA